MILGAAIAAAAFNLICSGTITTKSIIGDQSEPYSAVYRMDLDAEKWCEGECKAQHQFAAISPTQLTLEQQNVDTPRHHEKLLNIIDRETGSQTISATSGEGASALIMKWVGTCEKAAFTGFPKIETKF